MEGRTDPILQDPFGYRRGSNKVYLTISHRNPDTWTWDKVSSSNELSNKALSQKPMILLLLTSSSRVNAIVSSPVSHTHVDNNLCAFIPIHLQNYSTPSYLNKPITFGVYQPNKNFMSGSYNERLFETKKHLVQWHMC